MIEAERILLSHALKDPFNERFVFVSDRYSSRLFLEWQFAQKNEINEA